MAEHLKFKIDTNIQILDKTTGEILVQKQNAIHPTNMANIIGDLLTASETATFPISKMKFGRGGTLTSNGIQTLKTPNTTTINSTLYEAIHEQALGTSAQGLISFIKTNSPPIIKAEITLPVNVTNNINSTLAATNSFTLNELGLFGQNSSGDDIMLTHLIFPSISKTASSILVIIYTLSITVTS